MRVVVQRVKSSQVVISGQVVGQIGRGLNLLVGIANTDTESELEWMARKCLEMRLFTDETESDRRWQKSIGEVGGEILVVSQFTLYGDCRKGRRPSFDRSAQPQIAQQLYDRFIMKLRESGLRVETGQFGAMMQVASEINDLDIGCDRTSEELSLTWRLTQFGIYQSNSQSSEMRSPFSSV